MPFVYRLIEEGQVQCPVPEEWKKEVGPAVLADIRVDLGVPEEQLAHDNQDGNEGSDAQIEHRQADLGSIQGVNVGFLVRLAPHPGIVTVEQVMDAGEGHERRHAPYGSDDGAEQNGQERLRSSEIAADEGPTEVEAQQDTPDTPRRSEKGEEGEE
eukprot:CAMPEP_0180832876 /NCGR_PEP_ID=MMETSP1038_2-20121128/77066_1 /TAXON_ID=632150 /ORGANISM="Azadinium spinosum, Strain 3D9" /LENGTH=155 /DNA_ID=CAMNT_0022876091 /DNA_START=334 /DNA_END=802 /DNA_ORIENTATION=+